MDLARALDPVALWDRLVASDPNRERLRTGLRAVVGPVGSPRAAHLAHAATAVVLNARHLAPGEALSRMEPPTRADVAEAGRRLAAAARRTAAVLAGDAADSGGPDLGPASEPIARASASLRGPAAERLGPATPPVWLHWLERLDAALRDLEAARSPP